MRRSRLFQPGWKVLLPMLLCVAGGTALAVGQAKHRPKKVDYKHQVEQLEETWRTTELAGDTVSLDKLLSEDFVGISMSGQVSTKEQQLARMRSRRTVLTKVDLDDVKVKLLGTTAIVTSLAQIEGTNDGTAIRGTYRYTRVWSRSATGVWQITNFEATRVGPLVAPPPPHGRNGGGGPDHGPAPASPPTPLTPSPQN